jgi:hypothetical protein
MLVRLVFRRSPPRPFSYPPFDASEEKISARLTKLVREVDVGDGGDEKPNEIEYEGEGEDGEGNLWQRRTEHNVSEDQGEETT